MKINQNTVLIGSKVGLVPHVAAHVPKYHEWMASPELLELTASEPLSLEEEREMQQSWAADEDKCTFILIDVQSRGEPALSALEGTSDEDQLVQGMCGDVNFFLNDHDDQKAAEIEIMVAEKDSRRKGIGKEALIMMMNYGVESLHLHKFVSKISLGNQASLDLFRSMNFVEVSVSECFNEATLELVVTDTTRSWLVSVTASHSAVTLARK